MALALQSLGKQATVVMAGVPPAFLQPFPRVDAIRAIDRGHRHVGRRR